ncbi:MAG TPA: shikimate kinase [Plantibacter sp.]|uniref:shikimate kinase n=1 Tax=unclassified Plantibacter TaxID=2624265 RepID=UPI002CB34AE3|nr:shikimate kinase [Plantibacter sp.]
MPEHDDLLRLPVVLIGPMASGKSRVGKQLAKRLGIPFIDTDNVVIGEHGAIAGIFDQHGEAHFRTLERAAVAAALLEPAIVSLGGGAVLDAQTQQDLADARVVLLTVTEEAVLSRANLGKRPLLRDDPGAWARIAAARRPIYERLADVEFDTSHRPISGIVDELVAWVKEPA